MTADFADWLAICETKARYCRCLDTKDWAGYGDCFTADVTLVTPPGDTVTRGRDAVVAMVRSLVETSVTTHHVHNPEVRFDADGRSADVVWAMQDRNTWDAPRRLATGHAGHTGYGHYHERYVKCDDGRWRIGSQRLSYLQMDFH